jgi:hypothetical protein
MEIGGDGSEKCRGSTGVATPQWRAALDSPDEAAETHRVLLQRQPTGLTPWRFSSDNAVQAALIKSRGQGLHGSTVLYIEPFWSICQYGAIQPFVIKNETPSIGD